MDAYKFEKGPNHLVWCTALDVGRRSELDQAYQDGGAFLRSIGIDSNAEISRVLDVAMNPNSLFVTLRDKKRAGNAHVSPSYIPHFTIRNMLRALDQDGF